ncbi:MAG: tetratricopeptide repeat protein [Saprospiraceae bacterium]|nr:tetratricopeptide repeat protein [Saprospiraceae bacterium]
MSRKRKQGRKRQKKRSRGSINWWRIGLVLIFTFIVFYPSLQNEFVNWDDDRNLFQNEAVLNLSWENVVEIFTTDVIGNYNPLSNLILAIEHYIFKDTAYYYSAFHLVNILLHMLCVWLVFQLVRGMGFSTRATLITATLFAIHPMRVESVTWITEIKDVLYGSFYFASMLMFLKYQRTERVKFWWGSLTLFFIGLFAKIQMVILPVSLVLLDHYKTSANLVRSAFKKWPFFVMSAAFGLLGIWILQTQGSLEGNTTYPIFQRIFIGSYSFCVYVIKSIVPYRLSPLYPYPIQLSIYHYLSIIPFLFYIAVMYWAWLKERKVIFFGTAFFFFNIIMLLQILGAGQGYLADRFTYVAYLGLFLIYGHLLDKAMSFKRYRWLVLSGCIIIAGIYSYMSFQQTKIWKNSGTLWTHVLKYYDNSTLPYGNRANYYRDEGLIDKALADYSSSIRLKPNNPKPYNSRAKLYFAKNEDEKALQDYIRAIELDPDNPEYLINRGAAYAKLGKWNEALEDINRGLEINPENENGYLNRSLIYQYYGRPELALKDLNAYLGLNPLDDRIWHEKGRTHQILGNNEAALQAFNRAIQINQQQGRYFLERSKSYFAMGKFDMCKRDLKQARRLGVTPDDNYQAALNAQQIKY